MSVAAFKADVDVQLAVDGEFLSHRVELEGTEAEMDDIDTAQLLWLGHKIGCRGIKSVGGVASRVFLIGMIRVVLALAADGWCDVDARHAFVASCAYFHRRLCTLRDGDETVEGGQVGQAIRVGTNDAFCGNGVHQFAIATYGVDAEIVEFEMDTEMVRIGSSDGEGLADGKQGAGQEQKEHKCRAFHIREFFEKHENKAIKVQLSAKYQGKSSKIKKEPPNGGSFLLLLYSTITRSQ